MNKMHSQEGILTPLEEQAITGIKEFIRQKNPYEFQDMAAALLKAMGYYISFISPKGKDGGLDIIAHMDPLGVIYPILKVQVKHKPTSNVPVDDIRRLMGLLKDGDSGLFITSGYFTAESARSAREGHKTIRLLNIDTFICAWKEHYKRLTDTGKKMLPLHSIYFLDSDLQAGSAIIAL